MIPAAIVEYLKNQFTIKATSAVSGGCINSCYKIETSQGDYFLKYNSADKFPNMFEAEALGLDLIASTQTVCVPHVYKTGVTGNFSFLLLQYIKPGVAHGTTMKNLGRQLAEMHQYSAPAFGLNNNNYIGSLAQSNTMHNSWAHFFITERIEPLLGTAISNGLLNTRDKENFNRLFEKLAHLCPDEKPALLHGDLWNGNYLPGQQGIPYLVDPAVYYGNREMDIAMTKLFGGFTADFYGGYNEVYPLQSNWQQRVDLWNLYPLLVHVNLFGSSYVRQLTDWLEQYV